MAQNEHNNTATIIPVILCGGSGTRLWPASRESFPKQFLSLTSETSLLQNTADRALRIAGSAKDDLMVVTLAAMKPMIEGQLKASLGHDAHPHIVCEPSARNTAAAVASACVYAARKFGPDTILWVLPSDHHVGNEDALSASFQIALKAAQAGKIATFGIHPTRPDTGYGYIRAKDGQMDAPVQDVAQFVEKPNLETAKQYLASGQYMWNSGMFLFQAKTVLDEYKTYAPVILQMVEDSFEENGEISDAPYGLIESVPFDKAILEKSSNVCVVSSNPDWSDIGSWESLWDICKKDSDNNVLDGNAVTLNTKNSLIHAKNKLIAVAGLENIVVVETEDAILIMNKQDNDSMRALMKQLKDSGAKEVA